MEVVVEAELGGSSLDRLWPLLVTCDEQPPFTIALVV